MFGHPDLAFVTETLGEMVSLSSLNMKALAGAAIVAVALAGCGSSSGGTPAASPAATTQPTPPQTPSETPQAPQSAAGPFLDMCTAVSGQLLADVAGVGSLGPAIPVESSVPSDEDRTRCAWEFPQEARAKLGIKTKAGGPGPDIEISTSRYAGQVYTASLREWTDTDPETLIRTYTYAQSQKIGENAVAAAVQDAGVPMVQTGSSVVTAVNAKYWTSVTMFMCHFNDCGDTAVDVAKALIPIIPTK